MCCDNAGSDKPAAGECPKCGEEVDEDGLTTRIITRTERVFMPETTIHAIDKLNVMDGDNKAPGGGNTSDLSIENLLLSIGR